MFLNCLVSLGPTRRLDASKSNVGNSKLKFIKKFKVNFNLEKYLTCVSVRAHRAALAKFRTRAH